MTRIENQTSAENGEAAIAIMKHGIEFPSVNSVIQNIVAEGLSRMREEKTSGFVKIDLKAFDEKIFILKWRLTARCLHLFLRAFPYIPICTNGVDENLIRFFETCNYRPVDPTLLERDAKASLKNILNDVVTST